MRLHNRLNWIIRQSTGKISNKYNNNKKPNNRNRNDAAARVKPTAEKVRSTKDALNQQRYVVETITMTTVTERRIVHEETNTTNSIVIAPTALAAQQQQQQSSSTMIGSGAIALAPMAPMTSYPSIDKAHDSSVSGGGGGGIIDNNSSISHSTYLTTSGAKDISLKPNSISAQITGILKGGKLWKTEQSQVSMVPFNI